MGATPKKIQYFWLNIFLKSLCETSDMFKPHFNTYSIAFIDLLSYGSPGAPLGLLSDIRI